MSSSSAASNVNAGIYPTRSFLGRIAEQAPLALYAVCGLLFTASLGGLLLLGYTRNATDRALEAVGLVGATQTALTNELMARDVYDRRPTRETAAAQLEAQQHVLDTLRRLATTAHSSAAHQTINDETIVLHEAVAGTLGQPSAVTQVRRSLEHASDEILAENRSSVATAHAAQSAVLMAGPVLLILGFASIVLLSRLTFIAQARREKRIEDGAAAVCHYERRFRSMVHNAVDMVLLCDASGRVIYQSPSAESRWGYGAGSLLSHPVLAITHPDERNVIMELGIGAHAMARPANTASRIDARLLDGFGQWRDTELTVSNLLANPDVQAIVIVARDIGHRTARERALVSHALYDPSTGLPNLVLLQDRLEQALIRARRFRKPIGLMFASIQTSEGAADAILETVGRLRMSIRAADTIARLHDGTLAVVMEDLEDEAAARAVVARITDECNRLAHRELPGTPSPLAIGMTFGDPVHTTGATLMQEAGLALRRAGAGQWVLFEADMQERALDRIELSGDLRMADLRMEMQITYQPVMRLADSVLLGFEVGVTWHHPSQGAVEATRFSALAEESGLAVPIGRWLLEECCREVAAWQKQARLEPPLSVCIKVSARQFHNPSLDADVAHALDSAGLAPDCLMLEISESALLHDFEAAVGTLWALRHRGVRIAIDGLGSGYSALPMLQQLPIDALKLNATRLALGDGSDGMDRACAMAAMAASLNMEVSAEGIETAEQAALLRSWGCEFGQGAYYQAPLDARDAEVMVRTVTRSRTLGQAKAAAVPLRRPSPGKASRDGMSPDWPGSTAEAVQGHPNRPRPNTRPRQSAPEEVAASTGHGRRE